MAPSPRHPSRTRGPWPGAGLRRGPGRAADAPRGGPATAASRTWSSDPVALMSNAFVSISSLGTKIATVSTTSRHTPG